MENRPELKIYIRDMPCFQNATEEQIANKYMGDDWHFNLEKLPTEGLRMELRPFIISRGNQIGLSSMREDFRQYNILCRFLQERERTLTSLREKDSEVLIKRLKSWLLKNGYQLYHKRAQIVYQKGKISQNEVILYLKKILRYLDAQDPRPEYEKDVWDLGQLKQKIYKTNPIRNVSRLNFTKITQVQIREEIKQAIYVELKYNCLETVLSELSAVRRFSKFLKDHRPKIQDLKDLQRADMEAYLIYLNTEDLKRRCFRSELCQLKTILEIEAKILEYPALNGLFLDGDIPRGKKALFKSYSDSELIRLNRHIVTMDPQIARALMIHQMLGTRISDTLTLSPKCLRKEDGNYIITINPVKTSEYEKPISDDVAKLILKSIEYTKSRYGDTPYIFTSNKNPNKPFQYSMIQYQVMVMIAKEDLRDDQGERFGFNTHLYRHTYGRKLTEMHVDDYTISRLLGHANTSSVKYYRKMSNTVLEEETREMREALDVILLEIIRRWEVV